MRSFVRVVRLFFFVLWAGAALIATDTRSMAHAEGVKISAPFLAAAQSPTLAFLSNQELMKAVRRSFGKQVEQHKQHLINPALQREIRYGKTHSPFYHGQNLVHRVYQDILGAVYRALGEQLPEDFVFLRFWHDGVEQKTAQAFIDSEEAGYKWGKPHWDDGQRSLAKNILSTTYSLFGNVTNGSCAFEYYNRNGNNVHYTLKDLLNRLFEQYGFNASYIKEFDKAHELLQAKGGGSICQIFIPKDIVDQCVYISQPGGTPQSDEIANIAGFDNDKNRYIQITPFLRFCCTQPSDIGRYIEGTQARIVFVPAMLDPKSGVKIFRYAQIEPEILKAYQDKITSLCTQMVAESKANAHNAGGF
jgi:hypothetical protein